MNGGIHSDGGLVRQYLTVDIIFAVDFMLCANSVSYTHLHCKACSLRGLCLPGLDRRADAAAYIHGHVDEVAVPEGEVGLP